MTLHWLTHSDGGLLVRILVGALIFSSLAFVDWRRRGSAATKWREYSVLLVAVAMSLLYGAINDQITVTISPEYFLYGKDLSHLIGDNPTQSQLRWEAAKVGLKATWSAGLIFGVAVLLANNPYGSLPRMRNRQLLIYLPLILLTAAVCGVVGGLLGYCGFLTRLDSDFVDMVAVNMYRPWRFMSTWGVHLGAYVGGFLGTIISTMAILGRRKSISTIGGVEQ